MLCKYYLDPTAVSSFCSMEFKFRAIDNINPSTMQPSHPTVTYLPDRSLPMDGGFAGFRAPLATNEAALRREMEKEQIRRDMLRRIELEDEVRRELAMEGAFGTMQKPLNSVWSNSTPMMMMNPVAVDASQPPEIKHFPQTSDKDKVILLAKPDPDLYGAKRKALTLDAPNDDPYAIGMKKKPKEEWSCELCQIKATSESGLNAHLNGKKHKAKEAGQKRKIDKCSRKSQKTAEKITDTVVVETDQQAPQPCLALEVMDETMVDKGLTESKKEEQLVETMVDNGVTKSNNEKLVEMMADNGVSITTSKNEKNPVEMKADKNVTESKIEEQLVEMVADNGVSITTSENEKKLVEMNADKDITESKIEEQLVEKSQKIGFSECRSDAATDEAWKESALAKRRKVGRLWCEHCQIGAFSQAVMEDHMKGKKHLKNMKKLHQNNASPTSTSSISQKTHLLINDTDDVNKETDQVMTLVGKGEPILKMENNF
ncbi:uncharacterized protein [Medicago truncatula]|uniref:uncharacterized protein n=1 Tax=Medicago truncatula TaxID=3880 RepID=UPI001967DC22|nr:uncharacterized protein LOC11441074 [Medicago truncatula]